IGDFSFQTR
ncbi:hypothetical protein D046_6318B, partial [Vibrio parahaemolyticus V-223/04]